MEVILKKVAYFCEELSSYRIGIINRLAKLHDVTVYCDRLKSADLNFIDFKVEKLVVTRVGPFLKYNVSGFYKLCRQYDVVIGLSNLRFYQIMLLCLIPKPFKLALWGIGVTGSYTKRFGSWTFATFIRLLITRFSDGLIFYSERPVNMYKKVGYEKSRMYIAHNTVDNLVDMNVNSLRDSFIFVGTLYKAKGLEELIALYRKALIEKGSTLPKLIIIGSGELFEPLKEYVKNHSLAESVFLVGPIYDQALLQQYFDKAIFCVSPMQAGLSVLTSMSYGVPFITCNNAITGGELLNIKNNFNGIVLNDLTQLAEIIKQADINPEKFLDMGKNAFDYYRNERHPDIMANAIIRCVEEM